MDTKYVTKHWGIIKKICIMCDNEHRLGYKVPLFFCGPPFIPASTISVCKKCADNKKMAKIKGRLGLYRKVTMKYFKGHNEYIKKDITKDH